MRVHIEAVRRLPFLIGEQPAETRYQFEVWVPTALGNLEAIRAAAAAQFRRDLRTIVEQTPAPPAAPPDDFEPY